MQAMRNEHEANITADLYFHLRKLGYDIELEYLIPLMSIDLVVWDKRDETIIAIVEVKTVHTSRDIKPGNRQHARYAMLPLPVIVCRGTATVPGVVQMITAADASTIRYKAADLLKVARPEKRKRLTGSEKLNRWVAGLDSDLNLRR
jgi:hypothetical protein